MDPFDEFEMKPLTSGLGFHKKAVNLGAEVKKSNLFDEVKSSVPQPPPEDLLDEEVKRASSTLDDLLASLEVPEKKIDSIENDVQITEPLPRKGEEEQSFLDVDPELPLPDIAPPPPTPDVSANVEDIVKPNIGVRRSGHNSPVKKLEAKPMSWASAMLDSVIVLAISLVFLLSLLIVTKVDLLVVFQNAKTDILTQVSIVTLYLAVMQIYVILSRSFYGKTLAEWTFDLQLGDDEQQKKASYPLLVLWRSIVITLTGVVTLPLLSFITRRDLASYLSGLQLYRKKY